jgi:thiamine biosynthesis lipoprotein
MAFTPPRTDDEHVVDFQAMGGPCRIRLAGVSAAVAGLATQAAIDEVRRIEAKYSRYQSGSVVSRINAAAGQPEPVPVDSETAQLLDYADQLHDLSEGLFDLSSGVLRRAWDFKAQRVPEASTLKALRPLIGWHKVERSAHSLRLPLPGMELDFGGFGKEYACDRATTVLQGHGLRSGIVNLGGDLRVLGPQPDGRPWRIGISHPRQAGAVIAHLDIAEGALATSGDYERWFEHRGQRYCHLLNPHTGWPVQHWQGISVLAPVCVAAGALSTIAMLYQAQALPFLEAQGAAYLAIDAHGALHRADPATLPSS